MHRERKLNSGKARRRTGPKGDGRRRETSDARSRTKEQRMGTKKRTGLIAAGIILAAATVAFAAFFQGFETDTAGWIGATRVIVDYPRRAIEDRSVSRRRSEPQRADLHRSGAAYSKTFPPGGYTTSVDIYLDISYPVHDRRRDAVRQRHPVRLVVGDQNAAVRSPSGLRLQRGLLHRHGRARRRSPVRHQRQHQRRSR